VQTLASIIASIAALVTSAKEGGVFKEITGYLMYLTGLSVYLSLSANGSEPGSMDRFQGLRELGWEKN